MAARRCCSLSWLSPPQVPALTLPSGSNGPAGAFPKFPCQACTQPPVLCRPAGAAAQSDMAHPQFQHSLTGAAAWHSPAFPPRPSLHICPQMLQPSLTWPFPSPSSPAATSAYQGSSPSSLPGPFQQFCVYVVLCARRSVCRSSVCVAVCVTLCVALCVGVCSSVCSSVCVALCV